MRSHGRSDFWSQGLAAGALNKANDPDNVLNVSTLIQSAIRVALRDKVEAERMDDFLAQLDGALAFLDAVE